MKRVPLVPDEAADDVVAPVLERFRAEGREPIALYRALANTPVLLRSYSVLARSLRHDSTSERRLRELVILRMALLTGSAYEWSHHRPMAIAAGVSNEQIGALSAWEESALFDENERAALRCADAVHDLEVTDDAFAELEGAVGRAGAVEIVLTASFYEAVARLVQGLGVEVEPEYRANLDGFEQAAGSAG
jgi:alkylhydroperoxidase family enzyme